MELHSNNQKQPSKGKQLWHTVKERPVTTSLGILSATGLLDLILSDEDQSVVLQVGALLGKLFGL